MTTHPAPTGRDLRAEFADVLDAIAVRSADAGDASPRHREAISALKTAGFGALRVPVDEGGRGVSLAALVELLVALGAADPDQPRIWHGHLVFVEDVLDRPDAQRWRAEAVAGALVGGSWAAAGPAAPTVLAHEDDALLLSGSTRQAPGSTYADWLGVAARDDTVDVALALVRPGSPGVRLAAEGIGARSGRRAVFDEVLVEDEDVRPLVARESYRRAVDALFGLAALGGTVQALHAAIVADLRDRVDAGGQDAHDVELIGRIGALATSVEAAALRAARALDAVVVARRTDSDDSTLSAATADAAAAVLEAELTAADAALAAVRSAHDVAGAAGPEPGSAVDRYARAVRALAADVPTAWTARAVGAWYLDGSDPMPPAGLLAPDARAELDRPLVPRPRPTRAVADTAAAAAAEIAGDASRRDRDRILPEAELDRLGELGLLALTVPTEYGGPGLSTASVVEVVRLVSAADPNVGQIPHSHFVYLAILRLLGSPALKAEVFADVLAGQRLGNAQAEAGTRHVRDIRTTLLPGGPGRWRLTGRKHYATGALLADWVPTLAHRGPDGPLCVAWVRRDAPGLEVIDDWDGMGQRTTASGSVVLDGVVVDDDHVSGYAELFDAPQALGAFAQTLHAAIDAGIARNALREAADFVDTKSRPYPDAGVDRAADDPLVVHAFGELELAVRAAESLLAEAAWQVDAAGDEPDEEAAASASLAAAAARAACARAAVEVSGRLFEVAGTRSALASLNLDRHWRNARTHTLHDPTAWKIQHLGRWTLGGHLPPNHGQI